MIKVRHYRWGNTHHGFVVYLFGIAIWRHKRPIQQ